MVLSQYNDGIERKCTSIVCMGLCHKYIGIIIFVFSGNRQYDAVLPSLTQNNSQDLKISSTGLKEDKGYTKYQANYPGYKVAFTHVNVHTVDFIMRALTSAQVKFAQMMTWGVYEINTTSQEISNSKMTLKLWARCSNSVRQVLGKAKWWKKKQKYFTKWKFGICLGFDFRSERVNTWIVIHVEFWMPHRNMEWIKCQRATFNLITPSRNIIDLPENWLLLLLSSNP